MYSEILMEKQNIIYITPKRILRRFRDPKCEGSEVSRIIT